jgi:flagella basal body P-ring formation protein FlgA
MGTEANAANRVVETAQAYLIERYELDPESVTLQMRENRSFDQLRPTDSLRVYSTSSSPPRGSWPLKFDIIRDGVIVKTISTSARVLLSMDAYVARSRIRRGETICPEHLSIERRDVTAKFDRMVRIGDSLNAVRARRTINTGTVIESDMIEPIPVICRGDEVQIVCDVGNMQITTAGIAKEDGLRGNNIEVMNKSTRRRITAVVESPGVVVVTR